MAFVKIRPREFSAVKVVAETTKLTVQVPEQVLTEAGLGGEAKVEIQVDTKSKLLQISGASSDAHWNLKKRGRFVEITIPELPAKQREETRNARFKVQDSRLVINLPEAWELADDAALKA